MADSLSDARDSCPKSPEEATRLPANKVHGKTAFLALGALGVVYGDIGFGLPLEPTKTTFYLERETLLIDGKSSMRHWRKALFAFMSCNAANPAGYFGIPPNRVVELGAQIRLKRKLTERGRPDRLPALESIITPV